MLFTNTLAQTARLVTGYLFSFLLAPLMLSRLGLADFGIWAVTGAVATYAGLIDLGIIRSLARYIAHYDAKDDERAVRECVGLGLLAITGVAVVVIPAALLAAPLVADVLDYGDVGVMRVVLLSSAVILVSQSYTQVFEAIGIGLRRMVAPNVAGVTINFVNFGASVAVLLITPTLSAYAIWNAVSLFAGIFIAMFAAYRVWGHLAVAKPSRPLVREVSAYGLKNQVSFVSDIVTFQTDKLIIAVLIDVKVAGAYEIASRVVGAIRSLAIMTVSAIIPTVAAYIVEAGRSVIPDFYRHYTRRSVALACPLFALGAITAPYLMGAWLADVPADSVAIMVALCVAYAPTIMNGVGMTTAMGDGEAGIVASNAVLAPALKIPLSIGLGVLFGLWGILGGTFLALTIATLVFTWRFHMMYGVPWREFWDAVLPPAALAIVVALPLALIDLLAGDLTGSRLQDAVVLVVISGIYGGVYWVVASRLGWLPDRMTLGRLRRKVPTVASTT